MKGVEAAELDAHGAVIKGLWLNNSGRKTMSKHANTHHGIHILSCISFTIPLVAVRENYMADTRPLSSSSDIFFLKCADGIDDFKIYS